MREAFFIVTAAALGLSSCGGSDDTAVGGQGGGGGNAGGSGAASPAGSGGSGGATSHAGGAGGAGGVSPTGTGGAGGSGASGGSGGGSSGAIQTVFVILFENHNWSQIKGSSGAPYLNGLLAQGAHCEQYFNPPGNHPSEPNYIWLEAGDNLGITGDGNPSSNHQSTTDHLVTYLEAAGVTWKTYQEDISGTTCPLNGVNEYAPKHDPFVFFDDVTDTNDANSAHCKAHVRPFTELASDLTGGTVARYNFITPNLCDDMHDCPVENGDEWLSEKLPPILASDAYNHGGVVFITWDEAASGDGPIGLIALSPKAKVGSSSDVHHDHSSLVKTVQEIFGVTPLLRHAGDAATTDLAELFTTFP